MSVHRKSRFLAALEMTGGGVVEWRESGRMEGECSNSGEGARNDGEGCLNVGEGWAGFLTWASSGGTKQRSNRPQDR